MESSIVDQYMRRKSSVIWTGWRFWFPLYFSSFFCTKVKHAKIHIDYIMLCALNVPIGSNWNVSLGAPHGRYKERPVWMYNTWSEILEIKWQKNGKSMFYLYERKLFFQFFLVCRSNMGIATVFLCEFFPYRGWTGQLVTIGTFNMQGNTKNTWHSTSWTCHLGASSMFEKAVMEVGWCVLVRSLLGKTRFSTYEIIMVGCSPNLVIP